MKTRTVNRVTLIGNLVKKPDLKKTNRDISVSTFHLITDREWKGNDGEQKKESTLHVCVAWDRLAEICNELLDKGDLIFIEGRLHNHNFITPEGKEETETHIVVNEMLLINKNDEPEQRKIPELTFK